MSDNEERYLEDDVETAELLRSLDAVAQSWEREEITIEEMTRQLEELNKIAEGESSFCILVEKFKMKIAKPH